MIFTATFAGGLSLIGRNASESGTTIKTFTTKMIQMEERARKMFDVDTAKLYYDTVNKAINRQGVGSKITADYLSRIAQEDLPQATELLSKLTVAGEVSQATLNKMFTIWNSPYTSSYLRSINGDLETYTKNMSETRKVNDDANLQYYSLNNQLELFKNNIIGIKSPLLDISKDFLGVTNTILGFTNATKETNSSIKNSNNFLVESGVDILSFLGTVSTISMIKQISEISGLTKTLEALKDGLIGVWNGTETVKTSMKGSLPIFGWMSIAVGVLTATYIGLMYRMQEQIRLNEEFGESIKKHIQNINLLSSQTKNITNLTKDYENQLKEMSTTNYMTSMNNQWDNTVTLIGNSTNQLRDFVNELKNMPKNIEFNPINMDSSKKVYEQEKLTAKERNVFIQSMMQNKNNFYEAYKNYNKVTQNKSFNFNKYYEEFKQAGSNISNYQKFANETFMTAQEKFSQDKLDNEKAFNESMKTILDQRMLNETSNNKLMEETNKRYAESKISIFNTILNSKDIKTAQDLENALSKVGEKVKDFTGYLTAKKLYNKNDGGFIDFLKNTDTKNIISNIQETESSIKSLKDLLDNEDYNKQLKNATEIQKVYNIKEEKGIPISLQDKLNKENADATLAIYDMQRKRLGELYDTKKEQEKSLNILIDYGINKQEEKIKYYDIEKKSIEDLYASAIKNKKAFELAGTSKIFDFNKEEILKKYQDLQNDIKTKIQNASFAKIGDKVETLYSPITDFTDMGLDTKIKELQNTMDTFIPANKQGATETELAKFKATQEILQNLIAYRATYINQEVDITKNEKDRLNYNKQIEDIKFNINSLNYSELEIAQKKVDNAKQEFINANGTLDIMTKLYAFENAKKDLENIKLKQSNNYKSSLQEILGFGKDSVYTSKQALDVEKANLQSYKEQNKYNEDDLVLKTLENKVEIARLVNEKAVTDKEKELKNISFEKYAIGLDELSLSFKHLDMLEKTKRGKMTEVEWENHLLNLEKERYNITLNRASATTKMIETLAKGESLSPTYNSQDLNTGITNLFKGKDVSANQNLAIGSYALTQVANVYGQINAREQKNIDKEISTLEMRKSLLTDEKDIREQEWKIIELKKKQIDKQVEQQQINSILGGGTQGASLGMQLGGVEGAVVGGILGLGMGLFGADQAKKDAEYQKEQLEEQQRINEELQRQSKLMEQQNEFYQTWLKYSFSGVNYAMAKAFKTSPFETGEGSYYKKSTSMFEFEENKNKAKLESKINQTQYENDLSTYGNKIKKLQEEYNNTLYAPIDYTSDKGEELKQQKLSEIDNLIYYNKQIINYSKENAKKFNNIYKQYLDTENSYIKEKQAIYSSYFGWELKQYVSTDEAVIKKLAQEGEYYKESWKQREDIVNHFVENAKTGANDISKYMGEFTLNSITSAWIRNFTGLNDVLNNTETHISNLSDFISTHLDKEFLKLSDFNYVTGNQLTEMKWNNYLQDLVNDYKSLSTQQNIINNQANQFTKLWIEAGGEISDIIDMLPQFSKDLQNSIQNALLETNYVDRFNSIGDTLSKTLSEKITQGIFEARYTEAFTSINDQLTAMMNSNDVSVSGMLNLRNQVQQYSTQMQSDSYKIKGMLDLLKIDSNVDYTSQSQQINYETGSTKNNVYNVYNSVQFDIGNAIASDSAMRELSDNLIGYLAESARNSNIKFE